MNGTFKFLIAAGAACLILGGALLALKLTEEKPEEAPAENPETKLWYEKNPELLKSIKVSHKNGEYTLVKSSSGWEIEGLEGLPLDETTLSDIEEAASKLTTQKLIDENAGDLGAFGLLDPALTVRVEFSDSANTAKEFSLGGELLDSSLSYFSFKGENAVYAVKASSFAVFKLLPEELLSLELFPALENTIVPQELKLKKSGWNETLVLSGTISEEEGTGYLNWAISSPEDAALNANDYTLNLWGLKADSVAAVRPDEELLKNSGITSAFWEATLSASGKSYTLKISEDSEGFSYVFRDGVPILYKIKTAELPWNTLSGVELPAESE